MEIITGSKRRGLHFQIQVRLVWEGHSSCTPNPDENPWPRCLVRSARAEAKDGTPCTCHLWDLGERICASPHVLALLHKRCSCLEPQPKSDFLLWPKTPRLHMQFPELDVCSSTCTQVCSFSISACRAVYKRCSSHLASSWLCPAVSTCLDKSVHQLSRVSCPSTQHLYNMHLLP